MLFPDEEKPRRAHVEIIPMIDVMMFLMVFFVLISLNVIPATGLKTHLPSAQASSQLDVAHHALVVLAPDGSIRLDGRTVAAAALVPEFRALAGQYPKLDVVINGDKDARVEMLVAAMDAARTAGIRDVAIATRRKAG
ncbi:MAG: biopolymer transporter ExbD [Zoogloea sp.]|nr:biopolymer transporter ExbD [Zoogloea sp.]